MTWVAEAYDFFLANTWWLVALIPVAIVALFVKTSR